MELSLSLVEKKGKKNSLKIAWDAGTPVLISDSGSAWISGAKLTNFPTFFDSFPQIHFPQIQIFRANGRPWRWAAAAGRKCSSKRLSRSTALRTRPTRRPTSAGPSMGFGSGETLIHGWIYLIIFCCDESKMSFECSANTLSFPKNFKWKWNFLKRSFNLKGNFYYYLKWSFLKWNI